jgi:hypothetical protein
MRHILSYILITCFLSIVALLSSDYKLYAIKTDNGSVLLVGQSVIRISPQYLINNSITGHGYYKPAILNYNVSNNGNSTAALIGKTEVNRLPSPRIAPPGSHSQLIPFHPKNQSAYFAAKKGQHRDC